MNVTLNISNDEELRSYVKDLIKGQVLSIVRDELKEIITQEFDRKLNGLDKDSFERMLADGVKAAAKSVANGIIIETLDAQTWKSTIVNPLIEKKVDDLFKSYGYNPGKIINDAVNAKLKSLII